MIIFIFIVITTNITRVTFQVIKREFSNECQVAKPDPRLFSRPIRTKEIVAGILLKISLFRQPINCI